MNSKFLAILNTVVDIIDAYLFSTAEPQFVHSLSKSVKRWIWFTVSSSILLLSTWLIILSGVFFYLVVLGFSHIQATLAIFGINLIALLLLLLWVQRIKKHFLTLRRSGIMLTLAYLVKAINRLRHK